MTISRGQMKRQLRMGGGIMDVVPRDKALLGGIKKAVKKVTKGVKDIVSSDAGKAALLAAATFKLGGGQFGKIGKGPTGFKFSNIIPAIIGSGDSASPMGATPGILGKLGLTEGYGNLAIPFLSKKGGLDVVGEGKGLGTLGRLATLGAVSSFLTSQYGMTEEQAEEELARDPAPYLRRYYTNLNPNAGSEEIEEFVRQNSADGGRIGFAEGPVLPPDPTQPVNPFGPKPGDFGIEEDIPIKMASNIENDKILEALFEKYLDMGLSPKDAAKAAQEEFDRMSKMKMESTRGLAALGGRMNFDKGTPMGLAGLGSLMDEEMVVIIQFDENGQPILKQVPKSSVMPNMKGSENIKRMEKAEGDSASTNAMQAAGIEGLPIRQNPKGVKELDLRKTGGFIPPVGIKEKEDDIPAMLSNNEFVFTADAVRGMGDGNVNLGAQRMYDMMKKLEEGGRV